MSAPHGCPDTGTSLFTGAVFRIDAPMGSSVFPPACLACLSPGLDIHLPMCCLWIPYVYLCVSPMPVQHVCHVFPMAYPWVPRSGHVCSPVPHTSHPMPAPLGVAVPAPTLRLCLQYDPGAARGVGAGRGGAGRGGAGQPGSNRGL